MWNDEGMVIENSNRSRGLFGACRQVAMPDNHLKHHGLSKTEFS